MALTDKKRKFADAIMSGKYDDNHAAAAIYAGYSDKGAAAAASRLMKDPDVIAHLQRKSVIESAKEVAKESGKQIDIPALSQMFSDPKDFLRAMMNDAGEDPRLRLEAAKTLMPYEHGKVADKGKKESKQGAAREASAGRFSAARPPLRSVK